MAVAVLLARRVSGPILSLATFMRGVGSGDLSARADLRGSREFRELSDALNRMIADLRDRVRLRGAIAMATAVQQKLLPGAPPAGRQVRRGRLRRHPPGHRSRCPILRADLRPPAPRPRRPPRYRRRLGHGQPDFHGKDRVRAIVRARGTDSAEQIATAIREDLDAFRARGHQRDDVTLVVVKVLGDAPESNTSPRPRLVEDPALPLR